MELRDSSTRHPLGDSVGMTKLNLKKRRINMAKQLEPGEIIELMLNSMAVVVATDLPLDGKSRLPDINSSDPQKARVFHDQKNKRIMHSVAS